MGKAINLRKRVSSYFLNKNFSEKTSALVSQVDKIKTISVRSEIEAFLLEERLIKKYIPRYNISLKDDKSFSKIEITTSEIYPSVLFVRKALNKDSLIFGPYTNAGDVRLVLKILRKIFPFQSVRNHGNKLCFYYHLGLCPCPSVTHDQGYRKNIKHIIDFLEGNTKKVIKDLEKERNEYARTQDFEKAAEIQRKINVINLVTSPFYKPFEYELNPEFKSDVLKKELKSLLGILNFNGVIVEKLDRIECYDISNLMGKNATASLVVLKNGEKDTDSYRRFKIKGFYNNKPNDFAMLSEVIKRRFNHKDWPTPDLIVIDGGKGQVSTVKKVLESLGIKIPVIGLAKKDEVIVTSSLKEIKLPKDSKALQIIMKVRNEAHRFAIAYHKKLRSKFIFD